jgi:hypothetical protein
MANTIAYYGTVRNTPEKSFIARVQDEELREQENKNV